MLCCHLLLPLFVYMNEFELSLWTNIRKLPSLNGLHSESICRRKNVLKNELHQKNKLKRWFSQGISCFCLKTSSLNGSTFGMTVQCSSQYLSPGNCTFETEQWTTKNVGKKSATRRLSMSLGRNMSLKVARDGGRNAVGCLLTKSPIERSFSFPILINDCWRHFAWKLLLIEQCANESVCNVKRNINQLKVTFSPIICIWKTRKHIHNFRPKKNLFRIIFPYVEINGYIF